MTYSMFYTVEDSPSLKKSTIISDSHEDAAWIGHNWCEEHGFQLLDITPNEA